MNYGNAKIIGFGNANCLSYGWLRNIRKFGKVIECHSPAQSLLDDPIKKYPEDSSSDIFYYNIKKLNIRTILLYYYNVSRRKKNHLLFLNQEWIILANIRPQKSILLLTGTEIDIFADYKKMLSRSLKRKYILVRPHVILSDIIQCYLTRRAIKTSNVVIYFLEGLEKKGDVLLKYLRGGQKIFRGTYMDDYLTHDFTPTTTSLPKSKINILCSSRHNWKRDSIVSNLNNLDLKDTNRLIEAFDKLSNKEDYHITLFEKGLHVEELKQLIKSRGLEKHCTWIREVTPHQFYSYVSSADIIVDNLGPSALGLGTFESMLLEKPVLVRVDNIDIYKKAYADFPLNNCDTVEKLSQNIMELKHPEQRKKRGLANRVFVENNILICSQVKNILTLVDEEDMTTSE